MCGRRCEEILRLPIKNRIRLVQMLGFCRGLPFLVDVESETEHCNNQGHGRARETRVWRLLHRFIMSSPRWDLCTEDLSVYLCGPRDANTSLHLFAFRFNHFNC